jgi:hypothetical protein
MRFQPKSLALAVAAAIGTVPAAHALDLATTSALLAGGTNVSILSGATAPTKAIYRSIRDNLCQAGTFDIYRTGAQLGVDPGDTLFGNQFIYSCTLGAGAGALSGSNWAFNISISGGSLTSLRGQSTANNTCGTGINCQNSYIPSGMGGCSAAATFNNTLGDPTHNGCTASVRLQSHGGFSDVEQGMFLDLVATYTSLPAGLTQTGAKYGQVFGVAVSEPLYRAMQRSQSANIPNYADCTNDTFSTGTIVGGDDRRAECQPTISSQVLSSLLNNLKNSAKTAGALTLAATDGSGVAIPSGTALATCLRPATSGTKASTVQYFLSNPCARGPATFGQRTPAAQGSLGAVQTVFSSGTSDARSCLNNAATVPTDAFGTGTTASTTVGATYRIGILSAENQPDPTIPDTFAFIKLDGVAVNDDNAVTANSNQRQSYLDTRYSFAYESVLFDNPTDFPNSSLLLRAINTDLGNPNLPGINALKGIYQLPGGGFTNAGFPTQVSRTTRGNNSCAPFNQP